MILLKYATKVCQRIFSLAAAITSCRRDLKQETQIT